MALAVMLVSLAGFVGAYWKKEGLLGVYLVCMAILILIFLVLLVLAFVVNGAYSEYRLARFSSWRRNHITDADSWGKIRACLADSDICPKLNSEFITASQFFAALLSPIKFMNPTVWSNPTNTIADSDCSIWNNDPNQLCYNCDACKAGLLGNLRKEWRKANLILILTVVVLIWVYLIACSAYRNVQTEELFQRYKQGWA